MTVVTNNSLFIHIPKTGGQFITRLLKRNIICCTNINGAHGHLTVNEVENIISIDNLVPFCFIRHPAKYLYSMWAFFRANRAFREFNETALDTHTIYRLNKHWLKILDEESLSNTVDNLTTEYRGFIGGFYTAYAHRCKFVGRTETLADDFIDIMDSIEPGLLSPESKESIKNTKPVNVSTKEQELTQEMIERIEDSEKDLMDVYYDKDFWTSIS